MYNIKFTDARQQKLFTTLITQRISFAGLTQLLGIKEYVKWAPEVYVGLAIIFLINFLRMAPWCRNM
jgi:hypothetical protein